MAVPLGIRLTFVNYSEKMEGGGWGVGTGWAASRKDKCQCSLALWVMIISNELKIPK